MSNNLVIILEAIGRFADTPFFILAEKDQKEIRDTLRALFQKLEASIARADVNGTIVAIAAEEILKTLEADDLDEYAFARALNTLLKATNQKGGPASPSLGGPILETLLKRSEPLWISESAAAKLRERSTSEQTQAHDKQILEKGMQLWSLDYFLSVYKLIKEAEPEKKSEIIFNAQLKMPALVEDALSDDMLHKIVYTLADKELRREMIKDYYAYRSHFVGADMKTKEIDNEQVSMVQSGLQKYCRQLIEISLRLGIETMQMGLHFPYGTGANLKEVEKVL